MPTEPSHHQRNTTPSVITTLLPIMAVVAVAYLVTGIAMAVLPVYVHQELGFSTFVVGLVAGAQFAATLLSRLWAGPFRGHTRPKDGSDRRPRLRRCSRTALHPLRSTRGGTKHIGNRTAARPCAPGCHGEF